MGNHTSENAQKYINGINGMNCSKQVGESTLTLNFEHLFQYFGFTTKVSISGLILLPVLTLLLWSFRFGIIPIIHLWQDGPCLFILSAQYLYLCAPLCTTGIAVLARKSICFAGKSTTQLLQYVLVQCRSCLFTMASWIKNLFYGEIFGWLQLYSALLQL